jgi:hypothetical protein
MLTLAGVRFDSLCDYGRHRELTGVTYTDEWPVGAMVTVATFQTKAEIVRLLRAPVVLQALVGPEVTGDSGERYRVLCGCLVSPAKQPPSIGALKATRYRLVECIEKATDHSFATLH